MSVSLLQPVTGEILKRIRPLSLVFPKSISGRSAVVLREKEEITAHRNKEKIDNRFLVPGSFSYTVYWQAIAPERY